MRSLDVNRTSILKSLVISMTLFLSGCLVDENGNFIFPVPIEDGASALTDDQNLDEGTQAGGANTAAIYSETPSDTPEAGPTDSSSLPDSSAQPSSDSKPDSQPQPDSNGDPHPDPNPDEPPAEDPVPQLKLNPIARWDLPPHQRIEKNDTLNLGVVAFSKYGIEDVKFLINGGGYVGSNPLTASDMTYNDQSDVYEYWVPIPASSFRSDGPITVEAFVSGKDGGFRDKDTDGGGLGLDPLPLVVNPNGTLPRVEAFVLPGGNDANGIVNNRARPFGSIKAAVSAIRSWRSSHGFGDNADGGIVRLEPGTHMATSPLAFTSVKNEWLTITTSSSGNADNTIITGDGTISDIEKVAIKGVSINSGSDGGAVVYSTKEGQLWVDGCWVNGPGRYSMSIHPLGIGNLTYLTNSTIQDTRMGTGYGNIAFARGVTMRRLSDDAFQGTPMIVNSKTEDLNPGDFHPWGGDAIQHADAWQGANYGANNWIAYNYQAKDLHYQGFFNRALELESNIALVNVLMSMASGSAGTVGGLFGEYDHFLMWNCTFVGCENGDGGGFGILEEDSTNRFKMSNSSFRGNVFGELWQSGAIEGWVNAPDVEFVDNHYTYPNNSFTPGDPARTSIGEANLILDNINNPKFGCPTPTSPLVKRMARPPVPVDASGKVRPARASVGALEP